jgi:hypothetical protein
MSGDKQMIIDYYRQWRGRFFMQNGKKYYEYLFCNIKAIKVDKTLKPMEIKEFDPCAADFHCFPFILDWIIEKFMEVEIEPDNIKKAIWYYSSGINVRFEFSRKNIYEYGSVWRMICREYRKIGKYLIRKHYKLIDNNKN